MKITADTALPRFLARVQQGKEAQIANHSMTEAVFGGIALERGLVRTVKHRDHMRTYVLTAAGEAMLDKAEELEFAAQPSDARR